ncbi:hypothetical protein GCM10022379_26180 [Micromonospora maritima]
MIHPSGRQDRPATSATNTRHEAAGRTSAGPAGSCESRTPTRPPRSSATSTQFPPLDPLRRDLRQRFLPFLPLSDDEARAIALLAEDGDDRLALAVYLGTHHGWSGIGLPSSR